MMSSVVKIIVWFSININILLSQTILPVGTTVDDWRTLDSNIGWLNGDIITQSPTTNTQYHGLFDGDIGETNLSRDDIQLSVTGTLTMSFVLIFSCDIIEFTDEITVNIDNTSTTYWWKDTMGDGYPYNEEDFTINQYDTDPVLYSSCTSSYINNTAWTIESSITSQEIEANTPINIAFTSSFNYTVPFDEDDKYWAVTNITFTVVEAEAVVVDPVDNTATTVVIVIVCIILCILLVVLFRYCYKSRMISKRRRKSTYQNMKFTNEELLRQSRLVSIENEANKGTLEMTKNGEGGNKKKEKVKKKKQEKIDPKQQEAMDENKRLKEQLEEIQMSIDQLAVRQQTKDNQINEAEVKVETMKMKINNLNDDVEKVKKENATKELDIMRKDEEIVRQEEEMKKLLQKLKAIEEEKLAKLQQEEEKNKKEVEALIDGKVNDVSDKMVGALYKPDKDWKELAKYTSGDGEFVGLSCREFGAVTVPDGDGKGGVYGYKLGKNKWRSWMKYRMEEKRSEEWTVGGDVENEQVIIFGDGGEIIEIDTRLKKKNIIQDLFGKKPRKNPRKKSKKKKRKKVKRKRYYDDEEDDDELKDNDDDCLKSVVMNGRMHIFTNKAMRKYLIWNSKLKVIKNVNGVPDGVNMNDFVLIGLRKRDCLLCIGGVGENEDIWRYSLHECLWQRLEVKSPFYQRGRNFECVATNDERYIIMLSAHPNEIFVLDMDEMKIRKSHKKLPKTGFNIGRLRAFCMDYSEDEYKMILSGMMRESIGRSVDGGVFEVMLIWSLTNDIHIVNDRGGQHCRMSVDSIVGFNKV